MSDAEKVLLYFTQLYQQAPQIPFNFAWSDREGHFSDAAKFFFPYDKPIVASESPGHRRILMIRQGKAPLYQLSTVVFYDRYSPEDKRKNFIVCSLGLPEEPGVFNETTLATWNFYTKYLPSLIPKKA
jgi:hypothetical protein